MEQRRVQERRRLKDREMKFFIKSFFLSNIFVIAAAGEAYCRRGVSVGRRPALPIYWADVIIDTGGAAAEAALKTVTAHPFIFAAVLLLLASLFKIHDIYEDSLYAFRHKSPEYERAGSIFISDDNDEKKHLNLSLPLARLLYIGALMLLLSGFSFLSYSFYNNIQPELREKKAKRALINYNAKTVEEAYKNAR
jgi:hypothetical protein